MESIKAKLDAVARQTVIDCTFRKRAKYFGKEGEYSLLLPSGDEKYLSFWVRDAAMMAESGLIPDARLKEYIGMIAVHGQNGAETLYLENGLTVPPYAVADHIGYEGLPTYFPGTYSTGRDQGKGNYGFYPPFCDNYCFIIMVGVYIRQSGDTAVLDEVFGEMTLRERLELAFVGYNVDEKTEICVSDSERYTVNWGFTDAVKFSGKLLMASLFRYNAALVMSELAWNCTSANNYRCIADTLKKSIMQELYDSQTGWFYAATGIGKQHDVWGTAYAVFSGITEDSKTLNALYDGYKNGTAVVNGYVRHVLTCEDYSASSAWEDTSLTYNTYQNGAYWSTPTGWYAYALYKHSGDIDILKDFISHTDQYKDEGAPFEWINRDTTNYSGLKYGTSGVLPYVGLMKILNEIEH